MGGSDIGMCGGKSDIGEAVSYHRVGGRAMGGKAEKGQEVRDKGDRKRGTKGTGRGDNSSKV